MSFKRAGRQIFLHRPPGCGFIFKYGWEDFTVQYSTWVTMQLYHDALRYDAYCNIPNIVHWKCKNSWKTSCSVRSRYLIHPITLYWCSADKLSQNNIFQNVLSNVFEWCWHIFTLCYQTHWCGCHNKLSALLHLNWTHWKWNKQVHQVFLLCPWMHCVNILWK